MRIFFYFFLALQCVALPALAVDGIVYNQLDRVPIAGAIVTFGDMTTLSDEAGRFLFPAGATNLGIRAPGYHRKSITVDLGEESQLRIDLIPIQPKALYLSFYGVGDSALREAALRLIDRTELNALVIDAKDDRGMIPYSSVLPLAAEIGAQKIRAIKDMPALITALKKRDIYLIARIVVFKDDLLAKARPELAVQDGHGALWHDREGVAWLDPTQQLAWSYSIDIAEEAAKLGFDEIQFDYVRFPEANGVHFSQTNNQQNRVNAIMGFLAKARERLVSFNVFLSADVFGYVLWNLNDASTGQELERLGEVLDYICPILYPSEFLWGTPDVRNPVAHPYQIVADSLSRAKQRTGMAGIRFRPWLQDFADYAFDRRKFEGDEVRAQIDGADATKTNGWMLWNPLNQYSVDGLKCDARDCIR